MCQADLPLSELFFSTCTVVLDVHVVTFSRLVLLKVSNVYIFLSITDYRKRNRDFRSVFTANFVSIAWKYDYDSIAWFVYLQFSLLRVYNDFDKLELISQRSICIAPLHLCPQFICSHTFPVCCQGKSLHFGTITESVFFALFSTVLIVAIIKTLSWWGLLITMFQTLKSIVKVLLYRW